MEIYLTVYQIIPKADGRFRAEVRNSVNHSKTCTPVHVFLFWQYMEEHVNQLPFFGILQAKKRTYCGNFGNFFAISRY